jgi:hypothetical protein
MAIEYQGTAGATLQSEQPVRESEAGTLTSVREYAMDASERDSFLSLWPRGTLHPSDPRLFVKSREWDARSAGPVTVRLQFGGATDTEASYDTGNNSRLVRTEMIERVANITKGGVEYAVTYDCPTAYVEWYKRASQTAAVKKAVSNIEEFTSIKFKACSPAEGVANPNTFFTISTDYELEPFGTIETEPSGDIYKIIEIWQMVVINVT